MVWIPAGHFQLGSPEDQGYSDEHPQHRVDLSAFALGKFDVTFEEWDACVAAHGCSKNPSDQGWGRGRRPVIWVSWDDAQEYLRAHGGNTRIFRAAHRFSLDSTYAGIGVRVARAP
jgi:formylglycine-generating enzyme required for sulfatase activity